MKKTHLLISLLALSLLLSCEKQPGAPEVRFSQEGLTLKSDNSQGSVEMMANRSWKASVNAPWCKVYPSSGNGFDGAFGTLHIICEENLTPLQRSCDVTVTAGTVSQSIRVTQEHREGMLLDSKEFNLTDEAQVLEIPFWQTTPPEIQVDKNSQDWIRIIATKAMDQVRLSLNISRNTSRARTGLIHFRHNGREEDIIIQQAASDIQLRDKDFNNFCHERLDKDNDGFLSVDEALQVWEIDTFLGLTEPEDLAYFPHLESLSCGLAKSAFRLDILPALKRLTLYYTSGTFDISRNDKLEELTLYSTALRKLDLHGKKMLKTLEISGNPSLAEIDLSGCIQLLSFVSVGNTALTSLDLSTCLALKEIRLEYHPDLTTLLLGRHPQLETFSSLESRLTGDLDLSGCPAVKTIHCDYNQLSGLNLSGCSVLEELYCSGNRLSSLDISSCTSLVTLQAYDNKIEALLSGHHPNLIQAHLHDNLLTSFSTQGFPSLQVLYLARNQLSELILDKLPSMTSMDCSSNQLTGLTVSDCPSLQELSADINQLTSCTIRNNPNLSRVSLAANRLEDIFLKDNPAITYLAVSNNKLKELDLADLSMLYELRCGSNFLTSLDLTKNPSCDYIECIGNPLLETIYLIEGKYYNIVYDTATATLIYQ